MPTSTRVNGGNEVMHIRHSLGIKLCVYLLISIVAGQVNWVYRKLGRTVVGVSAYCYLDFCILGKFIMFLYLDFGKVQLWTGKSSNCNV